MRSDDIESFNQEAIAYLQGRLHEGKTFAHHLSQRPDLERGRVLALLSEGIDLEGPYSGGRWDFESGSVGAPRLDVGQGGAGHDQPWHWFPAGEEDEGLAAAIQEGLVGGRVLLLEDAVREPSDSALHDQGTRVVISGDEVYHLVLAHDGLPAVRAAIEAADWWLFVGALAPDAPRWRDLADGRASSDLLADFARSADRIVVGAYDGEGYLIWAAPTADGLGPEGAHG